MNGKLMSVSITEESSIFAFSAASFRRWSAMRSLLRSMPSDFLNSLLIHSMMRWSMLSPPRCVSPFVLFTSTTPSPTSRIEMSKVPPPKSYTAIVSSFFLSRPYASAAAVGSLTMRMTSRPAICPASFVACRCASLKYAGTVMTALATEPPRYSSAACFSFCRIIAEISGGEYSLSFALTRTSPLRARTTLYGTIFISSFTSSYLRPMNRLIEKTVFSGFVTAWRLATWPTSRSPALVNATTDGVSRLPSGLVITTGSPPSMTATTELVVPRSIPMILLIEAIEVLCYERVDAQGREIRDPLLSIKVESSTVKLRGSGDRIRGNLDKIMIRGPCRSADRQKCNNRCGLCRSRWCRNPQWRPVRLCRRPAADHGARQLQPQHDHPGLLRAGPAHR